MSEYRIYVEKKDLFQVEAKSLEAELNNNLGLAIEGLRLVNVYDLFGFSKELLEKSKYQVFGEIVTDKVSEEIDLENKKYLAVEFLPGQFDQRASSAVDCVKLLEPNADISIKSGKLLIFKHISEADLAKVKKYYINEVEAREKNLAILSNSEKAIIKLVEILKGFRNIKKDDLKKICRDYSLAMNSDDLACVVEYFKQENRDPYETELRILDTYWSDHCRHTTFTTIIDSITINESIIKEELEESLELYNQIKKQLNREAKPTCLMDLATIGARYLAKIGYLEDLEISEENNACSIYIDVDVDNKIEKWLLMFKNETHNHPTEIEPFGGASTCLGGAIRDPLSGRSYVYQAMRVTGAGNIYQEVKDTIKGKLPQRIISSKAAQGYSSYGNQIGLATTHVNEIYHDGYVAKRLEVGAVVGAVKASNVRRDSPVSGDIILLLGGRTGRDGIGGATGSSKEHNVKSIEECSSEVQKGNAPEERKLSRLFRQPQVTSLIKKANDFGAGGVSVAIGELADGLDIYLDRVPVKYEGLNATELAISESQERMAVVIDEENKELFIQYCHAENVEVTHVANVTDTNRLRMYYHDEKIVDISREFIDSAGAKHYAKAVIDSLDDTNPFQRNIPGYSLENKILNNLEDDNVLSQKGLIEMFDASVGASTVLMPFGGKTQRTETQVSVQKIPVGNHETDTASIMAYGYNPFITSYSPYHGSQYAVIEAISKAVASGAKYDKMRFSYQEYFERLNSANSWGKPLASLLGALRIQCQLKLPSIGGKDSMSGTYENINVPPMLMAFGITTIKASDVISPEFKKSGSYLYLIKHTPDKKYLPNIENLINNFNLVTKEILNKNIISAYAIGFGGAVEALAKMSFGNEIGCDVSLDEADLFNYSYGSFIVESVNKLAGDNAILIGETNDSQEVTINKTKISISKLYEANTKKYERVYKATAQNDTKLMQVSAKQGKTYKYPNSPIEKPIVYLPVFPGTNCDYDTAKAFTKAGGEVISSVFANLNSKMIFKSIKEMKENIAKCQILVFSGGFSAGDEPDGSGKFIANVLNNKEIAVEIEKLIERGGLILGICNGFQALVKSGLLPYGKLGMVDQTSPTLFRNDINRHISQMVRTRVSSNSSPWLSSFVVGETHEIAMSHGEGKFVVSKEMAKEMFEKGMVAFQYVDLADNVTDKSPFNPNGSSYAIEGIISENGQILGKMGHSERYGKDLFKNIYGNKEQQIFVNAINYFKGK